MFKKLTTKIILIVTSPIHKHMILVQLGLICDIGRLHYQTSLSGNRLYWHSQPDSQWPREHTQRK